MSKYLVKMPSSVSQADVTWVTEALRTWMEDKYGDAAVFLPDGWDVEVVRQDRPLVYLCGTITPDPVHLAWREEAEERLDKLGVGVVSPVRGKDPRDWTLDGTDSARPTTYANGGFVPRDRRDLERCDAVLLYFMADGAPDRQSIGTWVELGWANILDVPVVIVTDMKEVSGHPFVWRSAAKVCETLDEGLEYLAFLLAE